MTSKRFYLAFLVTLPFIILATYSFCLAQYSYDPSSIATYNSAQPYAYSTYQPYSYLPSATGGYFNPFAQAPIYDPYSLALSSVFNPYATGSGYTYSVPNLGNPYYSYNPFASSGYISAGYNPYYTYGFPLNASGNYNTGYYSTDNTTTGTTNSNYGTATANGAYITQATTYYPNTYPTIASPLLFNLYGLPNIFTPTIYQNPFNNYIPSQSYYQNPYISYPYNTGQTTAVNPYQGYSTTSYTQTNPYNQPLPYYQTTYYPQGVTPSDQSTLSSISGNWVGTWFTTQANGTVNNGEVNLSLTQNAAEITGTVSFLLNSYPKLSTSVNGTITGSSLALVGSLFNGTEIYSLSMKSTITGNNLSGTYTIYNNSSTIIESGTFSISRL